MYGTRRGGGGLTRRGTVPITAEITVRAGQGDGKWEQRSTGRGRRAREEGGKLGDRW